MKLPSTNYIAICASVKVLCNKHFLVQSHRSTSKHQKPLISRSQLLIRTLFANVFEEQRFCGKVTETFLSSDIPLYKLNNKHIKNLFHDIGHSLPFETICRKTLMQLNVDNLKRIRNAVGYMTKKIFRLLMRALYQAYNI